MSRETGRWYDRKELFELIWTRPIIRLAADFGISDVALAKKCKQLGIPRPERGYWARIESGQTVKRPELPAATKDQSARVWIAPRQTGQEHEPYVLSESV